ILPRGVDVGDYDFFASKAREVLITNGTKVHGGANNTVGTLVDPYNYHASLGGTMEQTGRPLSDYTIVFLYKNPDRTTLVHELIHYLVDRAQQRAIADSSRYLELGQNKGRF